MKSCFLPVLLLAAILTACGNNEPRKKDHLAKANNNIMLPAWLLGEWRNMLPDSSTVYERWEKTADTHFRGLGLFIKRGDTLSREVIVLRSSGDSVYYIPTVANQNNGQPVPFKMIEGDSTHMVFENKTHDFPQRISYALITGDSIVASISGTHRGRQHEEVFPMKRIR